MGIFSLCALWFAFRVHQVNADPTKPIGSYESEALELALARLNREIDPSPQGKKLGTIHVVNLDVFLRSDGKYLRWFNRFHRTTRAAAIRSEVLLKPGELWSESQVRETERNLRDPVLTNLVVIRALTSTTEDTFDLLVVTRDIWSLRLNSSYELQGFELSKLEFSLSENNFLGWRKQLALRFALDQGAYSVGPIYRDRNIAGTRLTLTTNAEAIFKRWSTNYEGSRSQTDFAYPLWSLRRQWGANLKVEHDFSVTRVFRGTSLLTYDAPETPEDDAIPHEYRGKELGIEASVTRSLGRRWISRFTFGHDFDFDKFRVRSDFDRTDQLRQAFERDVLPRSETVSAPFTRYRLFTPRYVEYHNLNTFDLAEDFKLGPDFTVTIASGLEILGSDTNHLRISSDASYTLDVAADGFFRIFGAAAGRYQKGKWIDSRLDGSLRLVTPMIGDTIRFAGRIFASTYLRETQNRFFQLGGMTGLRGYPIAEFDGKVRVLGNFEARTSPLPLAFFRFGALVFWDIGHAADRFADLSLHNNVGFGLRALIPQFGKFVYRFDLAFPLQGRNPGTPRFVAGVSQVF